MSANQPLPLLYSGEVGNYFGTEYEGLPIDVHPSVSQVGQLFTDRGLNYLGKLTCSQFSAIEVYSYNTADKQIAVSVMADSSGLAGIDCVSKFADDSFLTTTTTKVLDSAYDKQLLFRVSFPGLNATELLAQHVNCVGGFAQQHGTAQPIFTDLLSIAKLVDEYTLRQQSNPGHGFLQLAGGFAQASMAQMMGDDNDEDEDWDDEDIDEDEIEYDLDQVSPLVRAILQDDIERVRALIDDGVAVNFENRSWDEEVPLVAAVYRGNPEMIQTLIAAGADVDRMDLSVYYRPLGMAIMQNRLDLVELLLNAGASPEGGELEETGLALAIKKNNFPILQMLLEAGADPNAGMEDDYRAIMSASWYGRLEMVKLLVEYGADVNAWSQGETAIDSAARNAHQNVYDYLYPLLDEETKRYADKHGQKEIAKAIKREARTANKLNEKLGDAAVFGKLNKVSQLLQEGADPNAITESGKTPLIYAAMYGHKSVMEVLLDAGADPNLQGDEDGDEGMTALMEIASSFWATNRAEVIRFLVSRGADPNIQNAEGETALIIAGGQTDAVKALIDVGADLDLRDEYGNTAMMRGTWAVQQLLRQAGASEAGINAVALVDVAREGNLTKVEEILQAGANVNHNDGSALVTAVGKGNLAIVERLIQAGADVNLGWKTGFTPIAKAAYRGDLNMVRRLLDAGANPFQKCFDEEYHDASGYAELGKWEGNHKNGEYQAIIELLSQSKQRD